MAKFDFINLLPIHVAVKGCVWYIFASLLFRSKSEHK